MRTVDQLESVVTGRFQAGIFKLPEKEQGSEYSPTVWLQVQLWAI
jgi:hypothetical protein